jgi:tRNA(fMet)-specific endonuclease VapC
LVVIAEVAVIATSFFTTFCYTSLIIRILGFFVTPSDQLYTASLWEGFSVLKISYGRYSSQDFALSIISFHEQTLGAHTFINRTKNNAKILRGYTLLREILQGFSKSPVFPFDEKALIIFEQLQKKKVRIGTMDLKIASIALSRDLVLLTRNDRDFIKVPDLKIEDWSSEV